MAPGVPWLVTEELQSLPPSAHGPLLCLECPSAFLLQGNLLLGLGLTQIISMISSQESKFNYISKRLLFHIRSYAQAPGIGACGITFGGHHSIYTQGVKSQTEIKRNHWFQWRCPSPLPSSHSGLLPGLSTLPCNHR